MGESEPSEKGAKTTPAGKDEDQVREARSLLSPVDPDLVRDEIAQLVGNEAFRMILSTIEQVHNGHYAAMKVLFQLAGLYPIPKKSEKGESLDLAKTLLDRMGLNSASVSDDGSEGSEGQTEPVAAPVK
ncbi:MAG TPA: hypothetical protein VH437_18560 [Terriglobales bacterium]|jgi:hypothetical protein